MSLTTTNKRGYYGKTYKILERTVIQCLSSSSNRNIQCIKHKISKLVDVDLDDERSIFELILQH